MRKLRMVEAGAGYGPRGTIEGWQAGQVIEIDNRDPRQKAWADGWLTMGAEDVTDDTDAVPTPTDQGRAGVRRGAK
jgi:hypothetical protein